MSVTMYMAIIMFSPYYSITSCFCTHFLKFFLTPPIITHKD